MLLPFLTRTIQMHGTIFPMDKKKQEKEIHMTRRGVKTLVPSKKTKKGKKIEAKNDQALALEAK